jgi:cyclophilin family peptidyl-prolyl cis-trans isomerase
VSSRRQEQAAGTNTRRQFIMTARFPVKKLLSRCLPSRSRRRRTATPQTPETLEARILPAGNVKVYLRPDRLVINGDGEGNSVSIIVHNGNLVVRGLNDTTINGLTNDFVVVQGDERFDGRVFMDLRAGDDTYAIGDDVHIHGRLLIDDFLGNDRVAIDAAKVDGGLGVFTYYGDDSIRLNGTSIHGSTYLYTSFGDDLVVLDSVTASALFRVAMGQGDDGVDTDGNTFDNRFIVRMGRGTDDANFDGDRIEDGWIVRSKGGDDAVRGQNMVIEGFTFFRSTGGDDNFFLTGENVLTGRLIAWFGVGDDNLELSDDTETTGGVTQRNVEGDETDDAVYTGRFDAANNGLLARADALRAAIDGQLTLTLNPVANTTQSNGVLLTKQQQVTITGTTHADAVVTIDVDNDGFDDGTVVANNDGTFQVNATLLANSVSAGTQTVKVRSTFAGGSTNKELKLDVVQGTVVRVATTQGNFDIELLNSDAPITVANFLNYLSRYADSIIHRSERTGNNQPFVIQGGGFADPPDVVPVATDAPIANEFKAANSNVRGTIAMALPGNNINGGTSQWFINTGNNSALDSGKYTVFGKVLGDGMTVVDAIHALTSYNLVGPTGETALANVPLKNYTPFTEMLIGTATTTSGSKTVTGAGTTFLTDLRVGEAVKIGDVTGVVESIVSDTQFTLAIAATTTASGGSVKKNALPAEASFVTLSSVSTLIS